MNSPYISVIVTAHDRRDYLLEAVESIRKDERVAPFTEVIVVKNFQDPVMDDTLENHGVRLLYTKAVASGAKLALAIRASKGEILSFLEDDDRFQPGKLREVLDAFKADANLGFHQHRIVHVDQEGLPLALSASRARSLEWLDRIQEVHVGVADRKHFFGGRYPLDPHMNLSAISVRSKILTDRLPSLERIQLIPDAFLFFAAMMSPCSIALSSKPLTEYRIHAQNASGGNLHNRDSQQSRLSAFSVAALQSFETIHSMAVDWGDPFVLHLVDSVIRIQYLLSLMRQRQVRRLDLLRALARLRSCRDTYAWRTHRRIAPLGFVYLLSPKLGQHLYLSYKLQEAGSGPVVAPNS